MNSAKTLTLTTVTVLVVTLIGYSALAQSQAERSVGQFSCKDIMRGEGTERDVAIAFLHGYLLGKSGTSSYNIANLEKQTDAFIEHCLDHPNDKAEEIMSNLKK